MDPFTIASLILSAGQLGSGIYGMLTADDISPEMQRYLDILQTQASEGIPLAEEQAMLRSGSRDIGAQASAMQRRGAASVASRGMARSSVADSMIGSVNRTQAQMYSDLQDSIRRLDQQTKMQAQAQLGGAIGMTESMKMQQQAAAGQMIGGGLGGLMGGLEDYFTRNDPSELEQMMMLFQQYFGLGGGGVDSGLGISTASAVQDWNKFNNTLF